MITALPYLAFSQSAPENPGSGTSPSAPSSAENAPAGPGAAALPGTAASRAEEEAVFSFDGASGAAQSANPASPFAILRMVLVLALVAGLVYFVIFFLRRVSRPPLEQNPHLKILASVHLGSGRFVHALSLGGKAWLIGSGEGGVNHIADITDQETIDAMLLDLSAKNAGTVSGFQALLKRFSPQAAPPEDRLENLRKRRERFKGL